MGTITFAIYWLCVFLLEEELVSKKSIIKLYRKKLSLLDRKYDFKFSISTERSININSTIMFQIATNM